MTRFTTFVRMTVVVLSLIGAALLTWLMLSLTAMPQHSAYAEPTGGVVGTGTPASCTEAALVARLSGGGTITFNCGANPYTITLTTGKTITVNTTIDGGSKITLSGGGMVKIFLVDTGIRLTLRNVNLVDGTSALGGCVTVLGGTLIASQTTIRDCEAVPAFFFPGVGGAIYASAATVVMTDTDILNNSARANGGGVYLYGGQATFNNVHVLNNTATFTQTGSGGGIYLTATAQLTAVNSQFSSNRIGYIGQGGGVYAYASTANLVNAQLNTNHALNAADGGGLYVEHGTLHMNGGTVNGNDGVYDGGGMTLWISNADLTNVTIEGNTASSNGGGLNAYLGSLIVNGGRVSGNRVGSDGGGIHLYDTPTLLANMTINNNRGGRSGGGIDHYRNTLTLINVTLSGNINDGSALVGGQGDGGGVLNDSGTLNIASVTLNNNTAARGGGLYNARDSTSILTNATLSANTAITGGGVYNEAGFIDTAIITLTNVTFKDNSATDGGGLFNANDPLNYVYLKNTIIADSPSGGNCKGKGMASSKYSISSDGTCALPAVNNQNSVNPLLTYLANNGGSTKTHLPKTNSPAINGVVGSDCPSADQRGVLRPQGASCDIGAVERTPIDPSNPIGAYIPIVQR